jgi:peptidoglycan/LPS O-acetylase OafA/YrhL
LGVGKSESIVIRVAAAFLVSAASYHLVERYFLRLKPPRPQAAT